MMNVILEPERKTPIAMTVDVVVAGGGPAGLVAALAAKRAGADTLLVERYGYLGGLLTGGFVTKPQAPVVGGIPEEVFERARKLGGAKGNIRYRLRDGSYTYFMSPIDPETMKRVAFEMVEEAGVKLLLHSLAVGSVSEGKEVKGIIVENKSGRQAILADMVVDASGDADVAAQAGAPYVVGRREDGVAQPMSMMFRMGGVEMNKLVEYTRNNPEDFTFTYYPDVEGPVPEEAQRLNVVLEGFWKLQEKAAEEMEYERPRMGLNVKTGIGIGDVYINATRITEGVATNVQDLTNAEIRVRRQVQECVDFLVRYVPGFERAYLMDTPAEIGVRESRRIIGEYTLTLDDVLKRRKFEDVVAKGYGVIDIHEPGGRGLRFEAIEEYQIPYRCLVPRKVERLLVAGRCISCDHEALGTVRTIPTCMYTGQAAGAAAALSARLKTMPRELNVSELQKTLMEQNAVIFESVLSTLLLRFERASGVGEEVT
jgi:ribulose 1,5-bisphosphate synthetase/thiazole synthase